MALTEVQSKIYGIFVTMESLHDPDSILRVKKVENYNSTEDMEITIDCRRHIFSFNVSPQGNKCSRYRLAHKEIQDFQVSFNQNYEFLINGSIVGNSNELEAILDNISKTRQSNASSLNV